jgi:phosphoglycerate dehydrogenase-like enzyme
MITVLFIWQVREVLQEYLKNGLKDLQVTLIFPEKADEEFFLRYASKADIIVGWRPTQTLLDSASKLKLFINPGAGVQHLLEMFGKLQKKKDVVLVNGHGNAYFTAQHIVGLLLTLMNKIIPHHNWMVEGKWRLGDADARSIPLRDKRIGFLGYGNVNKIVHRFLSAFDVSFSIVRNHWDKDTTYIFPTSYQKYEIAQLHDFLKEIDVLIVAIPLTKETEGLIGKEQLELLGKKGLLVSAGRGKVVQEKSLFEALKNNIITSAAIDVWYDYKPESDEKGRQFPTKFPFYQLDNVVLSPHRAASPFDDLRRWDEVIENITRFVNGEKKFLNEVNVEEGY